METTTIREVNINYGKQAEGPIITRASNVADFLRSIAPNNSQEHVFAIYIDCKNAPIGYSIVSTGTANSCPIHPREIYQRAVCLGARAVILGHNHPSGSCRRSAEDDKVTKEIAAAGRILGITLLDHVIFSDDNHYSYLDAGSFEEVCR
jgi:DNA repair protein RadC